MMRALCTLAAVLALAGPALAQPTAGAGDPKACAPGERMQLGEGNADPRATTGESMSDKLARTDGVLCPPNVGKDMTLPTPDTGRTPVIPPPGTPGGDPSVQPK